MRILNLSGVYYCIANDDFIYEELEKKIVDVSHQRKNSFAEFYTKKIFRAFFQYARDLKKEYMTYYLDEYGNLSDYLYKKELLDWRDIHTLGLNEHQTLLKLNLNLTSYNVDNLIEYGENGLDNLNQALKEISI